MKNILQLFKKMQPKSYYGAGVAVPLNTYDSGGTSYMMYTVDETTDCRNIYSTSKSDMPVQGIGLTKIKK